MTSTLPAHSAPQSAHGHTHQGWRTNGSAPVGPRNRRDGHAGRSHKSVASAGDGVAETPTADIIFAGGSVYTADPADRVAEALAVHDGRILAVGSREDVMVTVGESTDVVDLRGGTLLPGLNDVHDHYFAVESRIRSANPVRDLELFQSRMNSAGYTGLTALPAKGMCAERMADWASLTDSGRQKLRLHVAGVVTGSNVDDDLRALYVASRGYRGGRLQMTAGRIVVGGADGRSEWNEESLLAACVAVNRMGLQLYVHVIGGASLDGVLTALEAARWELPGVRIGNVISYAKSVDSSERDRAEALGVRMLPQPLWHYRQLGSPAVTNPFAAIQAAADPRRGEVAPSVRELLRGFTIDAARAMHADRETGSLEVGKSADMIVVDRDILGEPVKSVGDTTVLATYYAGRPVAGSLVPHSAAHGSMRPA